MGIQRLGLERQEPRRHEVTKKKINKELLNSDELAIHPADARRCRRPNASWEPTPTPGLVDSAPLDPTTAPRRGCPSSRALRRSARGAHQESRQDTAQSPRRCR